MSTDLRSRLATRYLGMDLRSPVIASAGPLSQTVDGIRALADTGLGAVVMYSLFEEEIRREEEHTVSMLEGFDDEPGGRLRRPNEEPWRLRRPLSARNETHTGRPTAGLTLILDGHIAPRYRVYFSRIRAY